MRWDKTIASQCRYGDVIGKIFEGADIIWEHSESNYQGFANVFASMPDGTFIHYEWTYGSCSGCDEWESRNLSDDQVLEEVKRAMAVLPNTTAVKRYFKLEGKYKEAKVPTANSPTNGSIPGMLRTLGGDIGSDFKDAGEAFLTWLENKPRQEEEIT